MTRKIMGMLILLLFFMVKSIPLFVFNQSQISSTINSLAIEDKEGSDTDKETKQIEIADEDFIHQQRISLNPVVSSRTIHHKTAQQIVATYLSLLSPPPNNLA